MRNRGDIFVISGPSGVGKTTLSQLLLKNVKHLVFSISYTTRPPRPNEKNGIDYFFVSLHEFKTMVNKGEMLEWAKVYGHYYGTSAKFIKEVLTKGHDVLLDIDVKGAEHIKKHFPQAVLIFILPPSLEVLKHRLWQRQTEPEEAFKRRLESVKREIKNCKKFDYIVINEDLKSALSEILAIVKATKATKNKKMASDKKGISRLKNFTSKGTYVLILELPKQVFITVGKLGTFMFLPGFYGYIGSAQGGLYRRLKRYLTPKRKKRWHIDYILERATIKAVALCEAPDKIECTVASKLHQTLSPIPGFGISDCLCSSHLYYHPIEESLKTEITRAFRPFICSIIEI